MSEAFHSSLKKAVTGTVLIFFGSAGGLLFWFFSKIIIVRSLTQEEFGLYSLALAIVSIVALAAGLGLPDGVSRYISISIGEGNERNAKSLAAESIKIAAISGLVCFLLVFILSGFISRGIFFKPELTRPLKFLSLYIPLGAIVPVYLAILRGYGVIKVKSFADFGTPLVFCFFLGLFHMFLGLSLMNIIYAFVLSVGVLFAATATYEFKRIGSYYTRGKGESFARDVLGFSLPLLIVGV